MPNKKISQLNSVDQLFGDEKLLITQSGANKTSTVPVLGTKLNSDVGAAVSGLNSQSIGFSGNARASITGIGSDLAASIGALHRSPNAITSMFVYDASKDSDGGAWTEKCQHTSWYNETVYGKWLGAQDSETKARYSNASFGPELVSNGTFDSGISGWTTYGIPTSDMSWSNGTLKVTPSIYGWNRGVYTTIDVVPGSVLKISFSQNVSGGSWSSTEFNIGSGPDSYAYVRSFTSGNYFTVPAGVTKLWLNQNIFLNSGSAGNFLTLDNVSVRTVTAINTSSSDYFQLTTDGKFYRLWKNFLSYSTPQNVSAWTAATSDFGSTTAVTFSASGAVFDGASSRLSRTIGSMPGYLTTLSFTAKSVSNTTLSIAFRNPSSGGTTSISYNPTTKTASISSGSSVGTALTATISTDTARIILGIVTPTGGNCQITVTGGGAGDTLSDFQWEAGSVFTTFESKGIDGTISEVFRGNKREFPKLSAIVAEASNVTIYDLTESGRPMWIRFIQGGTSINEFFINSTSGAPSIRTIFALNGTLCVGLVGSQPYVAGLRVATFPGDKMRQYNNSTNYTSPFPISSRNSGVDFYQDNHPRGQYIGIGDARVNAVAMTVLPDAPIDPVTGLQVPTIAVATAGGVSVIKHNGAVVSNSYATSFSGLSINKDLLSCFKTNSTEIYRAYNIGSLQAGFDLSADIYYNMPDFRNGTFSTLKQADRNILVRSVSGSATLKKLYNNPSAVAKGVATTITNTFNTGHQIGDIRRTYLSDVDAGNVSGTNLVTNGTFDTDTTGWVAASGGASIASVSGQLVISGTNSYYAAYQQLTVIANKTYKITGTLVSTNSGMRLQVGSTYQGQDLFLSNISGNFVAYVKPTSTYLSLGLQAGGVGAGSYTSVFDNISVTEVVADRSYKAQSASVTGILTKSPVATNAQLVGYSGFSAANYLREPYSADLDFGTGEWSASAWVNVPVALPALSAFPAVGPELITGQVISASGTLNLKVPPQYAGGFEVVVTNAISGLQLDDGAVWVTLGVGTYRFKRGYGCVLRNTSASAITLNASDISIKELGSLEVATRAHSSGARIGFGLTVWGGVTATAFDGITTRTVTSPNAYNTGTWNKVRVNYTTDGKLALLVNGVEVASTTGTALLTLNNSNAVLTIGNNYAANAPFPGSLALVKFSATVPTTEQSQWMYEQEKAMFQPGAQVCLPSSNSVTDLTYDNLTDTWIAAQSTHVSEWKGLVRTSYRKPASGSFDKLSAASGVRLMTRSSWGVDIEAQPVQLKKELFSSTDASINNQNTTTFDFDAVTSQTDFVLPVGYTAQAVFSAGVQIFEGSTGNKFTRLFDGFKETIRFATAPGNGVWVKIRAVRAQG